MRETTSSAGAASSSGSLNGCTPSATPDTSSRSRWSSGFGTVGTNGTPSTSSRASTSAQPAFAIVVGSSNFFLLIPVVLVAIGRPLFARSQRPAGTYQSNSISTYTRKAPIGHTRTRNHFGAASETGPAPQ